MGPTCTEQWGCSTRDRHAFQEPGSQAGLPPATPHCFLLMTARIQATQACNLKLPLFHHPSAILQCPVLALGGAQPAQLLLWVPCIPFRTSHLCLAACSGHE